MTRDAVLYNAKNPKPEVPRIPAHGHFATQQTFAVAGTTLSFDRGWALSSILPLGQAGDGADPHLEVESQDGKKGG